MKMLRREFLPWLLGWLPLATWFLSRLGARLKLRKPIDGAEALALDWNRGAAAYRAWFEEREDGTYEKIMPDPSQYFPEIVQGARIREGVNCLLEIEAIFEDQRGVQPHVIVASGYSFERSKIDSWLWHIYSCSASGLSFCNAGKAATEDEAKIAAFKAYRALVKARMQA